MPRNGAPALPDAALTPHALAAECGGLAPASLTGVAGLPGHRSVPGSGCNRLAQQAILRHNLMSRQAPM